MNVAGVWITAKTSSVSFANHMIHWLWFRFWSVAPFSFCRVHLSHLRTQVRCTVVLWSREYWSTIAPHLLERGTKSESPKILWYWGSDLEPEPWLWEEGSLIIWFSWLHLNVFGPPAGLYWQSFETKKQNPRIFPNKTSKTCVFGCFFPVEHPTGPKKNGGTWLVFLSHQELPPWTCCQASQKSVRVWGTIHPPKT